MPYGLRTGQSTEKPPVVRTGGHMHPRLCFALDLLQCFDHLFSDLFPTGIVSFHHGGHVGA